MQRMTRCSLGASAAAVKSVFRGVTRGALLAHLPMFPQSSLRSLPLRMDAIVPAHADAQPIKRREMLL